MNQEPKQKNDYKIIITLLIVFGIIIFVQKVHFSPATSEFRENQTGNAIFQSLGQPDSVYLPQYSKGFCISYFGEDKIVEVYNPWDSASQSDYYLINNSGRDAIENIRTIKAPVGNWSAFSSTQVIMAEKLGVLATLKSVAEPEYISNEYIKKGISGGTVTNVGMAIEPNIELLLLSQPQFIFVSPFKDEQYNRLHNAGLITVTDAGYLEASPLGRTEWIVFFGAFFNLENKAISLFREIESSYNEVKDFISEENAPPSIVTGYLYQDVWFLPAGESYIATLFRDSGASYPYADTKGTGSLSYDFEKIFHDTHLCDFWLITVNHSGKFGYNDFKAMDMRYADFKAFKQQRILYSNTNTSGYYERGWIEPQTLLKDLAKAFYPQLFPDHKPVFFTILQ